MPRDRIAVASDGMKLELGGGLAPEIYLTPGHATHHISVLERASKVLLAGEVAGVCMHGTVRMATPPPFRLGDALASLDKLIALRPDTHFGFYDDAVGMLRQARDKLLEWHGWVQRLAAQGKGAAEIYDILKAEDASLRYQDSLGEENLKRERAMITNSIIGLMQAK